MARLGKAAGGVTCGIMAGVFVLLGVLWAADRTRRWETPRIEPALFSVVQDDRRTDAESRGLRLVPVNLQCPHCMRSLRALRASCGGRNGCADLVVLLVDLGMRPPVALVDSLRVARVWWDRRGVWRHRWGHRIYGEVVRFDASGRYLGTSPPSMAP